MCAVYCWTGERFCLYLDCAVMFTWSIQNKDKDSSPQRKG
jgi:hypothetical protein